MTAFAEYPKASGTYWALPAEVDAAGYVYRKDFFERSERDEGISRKVRLRALAPPETYDPSSAILPNSLRVRSKTSTALGHGIAKNTTVSPWVSNRLCGAFGGAYGDAETYRCRRIYQHRRCCQRTRILHRSAQVLTSGCPELLLGGDAQRLHLR